jgi:hypothetical protein
MISQETISLITGAGCFKLDEALRAVVELHIPQGTVGQQCKHDKKSYPCPTIQAIEKELTK